MDQIIKCATVAGHEKIENEVQEITSKMNEDGYKLINMEFIKNDFENASYTVFLLFNRE